MERNTQFVGQSSSFLDAVERASRAAPLDRPVLVIGERGTGKELIAERLHHLSSRWDGPLVVMNCAALARDADRGRIVRPRGGRLHRRDQGARRAASRRPTAARCSSTSSATLSQAAQERLLRAVEYGEVTRIGASRPIRVDVRIVAATNEDLPTLVEREPLPRRPARPAVVRGRHPAAAARTRSSDIPVLADHFAPPHGARARLAELARLQRRRAATSCSTYTWPGNVRELRNVVERAVYRWDDPRAADRRDPVRSVRIAVAAAAGQPRRRAAAEIRPPAAGSAGAPRPAPAGIPEAAPISGSPSPNMRRRSSPPRSRNAAGTSAPRRRRCSSATTSSATR